jgi:hypothetical protein
MSTQQQTDHTVDHTSSEEGSPASVNEQPKTNDGFDLPQMEHPISIQIEGEQGDQAYAHQAIDPSLIPSEDAVDYNQYGANVIDEKPKKKDYTLYFIAGAFVVMIIIAISVAMYIKNKNKANLDAEMQANAQPSPPAAMPTQAPRSDIAPDAGTANASEVAQLAVNMISAELGQRLAQQDESMAQLAAQQEGLIKRVEDLNKDFRAILINQRGDSKRDQLKIDEPADAKPKQVKVSPKGVTSNDREVGTKPKVRVNTKWKLSVLMGDIAYLINSNNTVEMNVKAGDMLDENLRVLSIDQTNAIIRLSDGSIITTEAE